MGEYATYRGERIKIGTCEEMYYLRFDQRYQVQAESGNVDPVADAAELRFRFPWPNEDHIEPGSDQFHKNGYHRSLRVEDFAPPASVEHHNVQFVAQGPGYNLCVPCPESDAYIGPSELGPRQLADYQALRIHRNGFAGAVHLVAQKLVPSVGLVPILRCGGCGVMWREQEPSRIEELANCFRREGERRLGRVNDPPEEGRVKFYHTIADRILAGLRGLTASDLTCSTVTVLAAAPGHSHDPTGGGEAA